ITGARRSSAQTSRLNSMISRIGEVATTEAVRKPPIATSGGADQSGGEISTAISPITSPAPIVPTVSPSMTTSAVPLSMAYSEYPARPSAASDCPAGISVSDAMLATAASSSSGKSAKKRIAASRNVSIFPRLHRGSYLCDLAPRPLLMVVSSSPGAWSAGRCRSSSRALPALPGPLRSPESRVAGRPFPQAARSALEAGGAAPQPMRQARKMSDGEAASFLALEAHAAGLVVVMRRPWPAASTPLQFDRGACGSAGASAGRTTSRNQGNHRGGVTGARSTLARPRCGGGHEIGEAADQQLASLRVQQPVLLPCVARLVAEQ